MENTKEKILSLIKSLDELGDLKDIMFATKTHYKVIKARIKEEKKYVPQKSTSYIVKYRCKTKTGYGKERAETFKTLKEIATKFGMEIGKITYCVYKKGKVDNENIKITEIEKIINQ